MSCLRVHSKVYAFNPLSYVIIQASIYLADAIIKRAHKGKWENTLTHARLARFDWRMHCVRHTVVMTARTTHSLQAKQLLLKQEKKMYWLAERINSL